MEALWVKPFSVTVSHMLTWASKLKLYVYMSSFNNSKISSILLPTCQTSSDNCIFCVILTLYGYIRTWICVLGKATVALDRQQKWQASWRETMSCVLNYELDETSKLWNVKLIQINSWPFIIDYMVSRVTYVPPHRHELTLLRHVFFDICSVRQLCTWCLKDRLFSPVM